MARIHDTVRLLPTRRIGGLLDVLRALPAGVQWTRGLEVLPLAIPAPDRIAPCPVGTGSEAEGPGDVTGFDPLTVRQGVRCSTLGQPDLTQDATDVAAITSGWALEAELLDGAGTNNPSLVSTAAPLGTVDTLREAVAALEAWAYTTLHGAAAVLHIPVDYAAYVRASLDEDGRWRTAAGNYVTIHSTGDTVYATGDVWGAVGAVSADTVYDRRVNTAEGWADTLAIVVFDPDTVASVTVNTTPTSV